MSHVLAEASGSLEASAESPDGDATNSGIRRPQHTQPAPTSDTIDSENPASLCDTS